MGETALNYYETFEFSERLKALKDNLLGKISLLQITGSEKFSDTQLDEKFEKVCNLFDDLRSRKKTLDSDEEAEKLVDELADMYKSLN